MKRSMVAALAGLLVIVAGCSPSSTSSPGTSPGASSATGSSNPSPPPSTIAGDVGRYFSIEEIGLGPQGWVTLHNYTQSAASLDTLFLCQPPKCVDLPDVTVEPGAVARIAVGSGSGLEDVAMTGADLVLAPSDGEVALYSTDDTKDSSRIWAYLEWGKTPHTGTQVAIKAGLWHEGSYAPTSAQATRLYRTEGGLWVFE